MAEKGKWKKAKEQKAEQAMLKRMRSICIENGGSKSACLDSAKAYVKEHGPLKGQGLSSFKPSEKEKK